MQEIGIQPSRSIPTAVELSNRTQQYHHEYDPQLRNVYFNPRMMPYRLLFTNKTQTYLHSFLRYCINDLQIPSQFDIFVRVTCKKWHLESGIVYKVKEAICQKYSYSERVPVSHTLSEEEYKKAHKIFTLESSNISRFGRLEIDILGYFSKFLPKIAPTLSTLEDVHWRYEGIDAFRNLKEIRSTVSRLQSFGFLVTFQDPYVLVFRQGIEWNLQSCQSLSIQIQKEEVGDFGSFLTPEELKEKKDAIYRQFKQRNDFSEVQIRALVDELVEIDTKEDDKRIRQANPLFVPNMRKAWLNTPQKTILKRGSYLTVEEAFNRISEELTFIQASNTLVTRYAFDVYQMSEEQLEILKAHLADLGYQITLDSPFIDYKFVGIINGFFNAVVKQYLLIDLPFLQS